RWYAGWGVAEHLWSADRALTMRCVNALAMEATLIEIERRAQNDTPFNERRQMNEIMAEAAPPARPPLSEPDDIAPNAYKTLDVSEWFGADANGRILTILSNAPDD